MEGSGVRGLVSRGVTLVSLLCRLRENFCYSMRVMKQFSDSIKRLRFQRAKVQINISHLKKVNYKVSTSKVSVSS